MSEWLSDRATSRDRRSSGDTWYLFLHHAREWRQDSVALCPPPIAPPSVSGSPQTHGTVSLLRNVPSVSASDPMISVRYLLGPRSMSSALSAPVRSCENRQVREVQTRIRRNNPFPSFYSSRQSMKRSRVRLPFLARRGTKGEGPPMVTFKFSQIMF